MAVGASTSGMGRQGCLRFVGWVYRQLVVQWARGFGVQFIFFKGLWVIQVTG